MASWKFDERPINLVEQDLTQRDQFNNDDLEIAEALVREVIQNSTDAKIENSDGPVRVRFALSDIEGEQAEHLAGLLSELLPHLRECGLDNSLVTNRQTIRILVIEDFNTRGLTGAYDEKDDDNFTNFWRRFGRSFKSGRDGGRWGLGKLVYSSTSEIRTFFGLTKRYNDNIPLLMGQCVLSNHEIGNKKYYPFGFYSNRRAEDSFQLPVDCLDEIRTFSSLSGISRSSESGLSIVIPYPAGSVKSNKIIQSVVKNYYFPILAGSLVVDVNDNIIDSESFDYFANTADNSSLIPFDFVKEVSNSLSQDPLLSGTKIINSCVDFNDCIEKSDIDTLKSLYAEGHLIQVRLSLALKQKAKPETSTFIDVFLKAVSDGDSPYTLFVRGMITVPAEAKKNFSRRAHAAMVASSSEVVSFLGDAENPAHTLWNERAEKLKRRWEHPTQALRAVRHALTRLHDIIVDNEDKQEPDALKQFFSLPEAESVGPIIDSVPRDLKSDDQPFRIERKQFGFTIAPGASAKKWTYPRKISVEVAYDINGSNPFRRYSEYDFNFAESFLVIDTPNACVISRDLNKFEVSLNSEHFRVEVSGFDENRDLVVDVRESGDEN